MPADTSALPGWVSLTGGASIRLAGWVRETTVGGAKFLEVCNGPNGERLTLVNAAHVTMITPIDEQRGKAAVKRQWAGVR